MQTFHWISRTGSASDISKKNNEYIASKYFTVALLYSQCPQETIYQPIQTPLLMSHCSRTDECALERLGDINAFGNIGD